jgi:hypothetical protein
VPRRCDAFDGDDRIKARAGRIDADPLFDRSTFCSWMTCAIVKTLEID